jgi:sigma-B regulation protein RsbU (phosphoserine phosphatase)
MATGRDHRPDPFLLPFKLAAFAPPVRSKGGRQREDLEVRLAALEKERREFYLDLVEAAHVQRRLSGPRQMRRGVFDIASEVFPVRHLAGDFVSAMDIGSRTWIALGDIAGKGIAAAMWFTHLVSLIRCRAAAEPNPAAVMEAVNQNLCELRPTPPITTMILLCLDGKSGDLEYCNAGHPPALLLRHTGVTKRLETGGPILGVVSGAKFETERLPAFAGDLLLGCSDGVLECRNPSDEEFGNQRFVRGACGHAGEPAQAILFSILAALQDFAADAPRQDDVSLLVIRHA